MKEETLSPLGQYIAQKIKGPGYVAQSDLAIRSDIPTSTLSAYMNGIFFPSKNNVEKLAMALGVEPSEIERLRPLPEARTIYVPPAVKKYEMILEKLARIESAQINLGRNLEHKIESLSKQVLISDKLGDILALLVKRE